MNELLGLVIGFILTLLIYSYLLGDNPLYRLAIHLLVGISAAYATVIILREVIGPVFVQIRDNPGDPATLLWLIPILFALLLILNRLPSLAWLGQHSTAFLVGVGAAVALTGAIVGTLWPQVLATRTSQPVTGLVTAVLTIAVLFTFQFTGKRDETGQWKRPLWQQSLTQIGHAVLMITFGALFAGVLTTSLTLLTQQINFFLNQFLQILS